MPTRETRKPRLFHPVPDQPATRNGAPASPRVTGPSPRVPSTFDPGCVDELLPSGPEKDEFVLLLRSRG